jgi:2-methylcitrate dehydratase PrpD
MSHEPSSPTRKLARFAAGFSLSEATDIVRQRARGLILDLLAVGIAATGDELAHMLDSLPVAAGSATVFGHQVPGSEGDAAFRNGALAHCLEYDDSTLNPVGHPSTTILPALLALAESDRLSGASFLEAYLVGLEAHSRLGQVEVSRWSAEGSWLPIGHVGVIGAALACGRALGLDEDRMEHAIALAAQFCGGLAINAGTNAKPLGAGNAARCGLLAARLAAAGAGGISGVIEKRTGFADTFLRGEHDYSFLDRLGAPMHLEEVGVAIKRYPSCYATHWGVDALLDLVAKHGLHAGNVASITLHHPAAGAFCDNATPRGSEEARFSHEYNLAVALLDGIPTVDSFTPERMEAEDVKSLLEKVHTRIHPEGLPTPQAWEYRVEVRTVDGAILSHAVPRPLGHPRRAMDEAELKAKFERCTVPWLGRGRADDLYRQVMHMERLPDLSGISAILRSIRRPSSAAA